MPNENRKKQIAAIQNNTKSEALKKKKESKNWMFPTKSEGGPHSEHPKGWDRRKPLKR